MRRAAVPPGGARGLRLADFRSADFDALVIGGGDGAAEYVGVGSAARTARRVMAGMMEVRKRVAAVGMGACVLAESGILRNKRVACPAAARDKVTREGGKAVADPVVALGPAVGHGPLLTGRDAAADALARGLLRVLPAFNKPIR